MEFSRDDKAKGEHITYSVSILFCLFFNNDIREGNSRKAVNHLPQINDLKYWGTISHHIWFQCSYIELLQKSQCSGPQQGTMKWFQRHPPKHMDVSTNSGTPKSSILIGFSIFKPSILGYPYFWKHPYIKCWKVRTHIQISSLVTLPRFSHILQSTTAWFRSIKVDSNQKKHCKTT